MGKCYFSGSMNQSSCVLIYIIVFDTSFYPDGCLGAKHRFGSVCGFFVFRGFADLAKPKTR